MKPIVWYAYLHLNMSIQLKRLYDIEYKQDCIASPFCLKWTEPFEAIDRETAMKMAIAELKPELK